MKSSKTKYIIGYDLSSSHVQISYLKIGDKKPETFSQIAGGTQYNIPSTLFKKHSVNQWYYGNDAKKYTKEEGTILDHLLDLAYNEDCIQIESVKYEMPAILALFIKRTLSKLTVVVPMEQAIGLMITVEKLDERMNLVLEKVIEYLDIPNLDVKVISKSESVFSYITHQKEELLKGRILLFELENELLVSYHVHFNRNATPIVGFVEKEEHFRASDELLLSKKEQYDEKFEEIIRGQIAKGHIGITYLLGSGFLNAWFEQSLTLLCQNRRVFQGNNLFSQGACYNYLEYISEEEKENQYIYLGNEKLKYNIGMNVIKKGVEIYCPILEMGTSWYHAKKKIELILSKSNQLEFLITPIDGRNTQTAIMTLEGLSNRENQTNRLLLEVKMIGEKSISIHVEDIGFGEFFSTTNGKWDEKFMI